MKLTEQQRWDLSSCKNSSEPIWPFVPPHKADDDLLLFMRHNLVKWTGKGYVITFAGRQALKGGDHG